MRSDQSWLCGEGRVNVPNRVMTLRQGFEALPCCGVPDTAVKCTLVMRNVREKAVSVTYISPSQAHETIRLASRLKCTAVT